MLCELSKFLSVLVFQLLKMVVRRGALRYWPGEGLEPIPNECPFFGYPAECCVRDALPGLQGPKFSSIKTNAICPPVDGRFDPLSVSFSEVWRAPEQVSTVILYYRSRQPMLCRFGTCGPTTATGIMAHKRVMPSEMPPWFRRQLVPMGLPSTKKGVNLKSRENHRREISCLFRENSHH